VKPILAVLVPLLLLAPALGQGMPPSPVKTGVVEEVPVRAVVTGVASVEPWLRTVLGAEVSGRVESYPLREGDEVEAKKTVVCALEASALQIDLAEAEALLERAQAESVTAVETARATMEEKRALLDRADRDLARVKALLESKAVTQAEVDRTEADAKAARFTFQRAQDAYKLAREGNDPTSQAREAEVRRAKARLDRVRDSIAKTKITSPVSGRVVRRLTEVGSWVNAGSPVIEIVVLDPVLVRIGVNEKDIAKVRQGDTATIRTDAYPGRTFDGKVRFIVPEADMRTRSVPVLIEVENADAALLPGMFARIELSVGEERRALTVPKDAIVRGAQGTAIYTLGKPEGGGPPTAQLIPVSTGLAIDGRIVVEGAGLRPGMPVITTGNEKLRPGAPVAPVGAGEGGGPPREGGR
jgi:multidrug efflux pump subunit AcrA (membrane-fusion protein)